MNGQPDPSRRGNRDWPSITPADGVSPINRVYRDEVTKPADTVGRFPKAESASRAVLTCQTVSNPTVGTITLFDGRLIKIDGTTGGTYQAASSLETVVRVNGLSASQIAAEIAEAVKDYAVRAHKAVGCEGVSRSDFRWDNSKPGIEGLVFLEVNSQPGMTPTSLLPEQAAIEGMSYADLCQWLVEDAIRRFHKHKLQSEAAA